MACVGEGGGLGEAEGGKGMVVFCEFDAGEELDLRQVEVTGAGFGKGNEGAGEAMALMRGIDGEFAEVEVVGVGGEDHAGVGWVANGPNLTAGLQAFDGEGLQG